MRKKNKEQGKKTLGKAATFLYTPKSMTSYIPFDRELEGESETRRTRERRITPKTTFELSKCLCHFSSSRRVLLFWNALLSTWKNVRNWWEWRGIISERNGSLHTSSVYVHGVIQPLWEVAMESDDEMCIWNFRFCIFSSEFISPKGGPIPEAVQYRADPW